MAAKRVPQRQCIGCGETRAKKELVRIVRTPLGTVEVDPTGKKAGRGAYICPQRECLEKAVKAKRLEKSLEVSVPPDVVELLRQQFSPPA